MTDRKEREMSDTPNASAVIDEGTFTVRRTIQIRASLDKVWAAVTEPALVSQWFGRAEFAGSGPGSLGTLSWDDHGTIPVRIEAIDAPHSISYRWSNDDALGAIPESLDEATSTVFTFTLEATDDGTTLTVVETGFENTSAPLANLNDHRGGWNSELDELVALLEGSA
jgi:uncharacterized protein YndB with AHSA1/START domain